MTLRAPLYFDTSNAAVTFGYSMNSTELGVLQKQAAWEWAQQSGGDRVTLARVASGGNLGSMTDRRYQAGAYGSNTGAGQTYPTEAVTDNISAIDTSAATIDQVLPTTQTEPTYTDANIAYPVYATATGDIRSMSKADFYDTFIHPVINAMGAGGSGADDLRAGMYFISTTNAVSGATLVSNTPVFVDTRADAVLYTAAGIISTGEVQDQPITINNYYLHIIDGNNQTASADYHTPWYLTSTGELRQYGAAVFRAMLEQHMAYAIEQKTGYTLSYNINGTGNNCGTGMADTYLSGTSAQGYTTTFDSTTTTYYAQEFPNGTPATLSTYYLKINQT